MERGWGIVMRSYSNVQLGMYETGTCAHVMGDSPQNAYQRQKRKKKGLKSRDLQRIVRRTLFFPFFSLAS